MRLLLIHISFFLVSALLGQTKTISNLVSPNGDTSFWYKYQKVVTKDLSLTQLDTSSLPFYFRLWKTNQVLDLWTDNSNSNFGQLTSWVTELTPTNEKPTDRTLIDKKLLSGDTIRQLLDLIRTSPAIALQTDDSIKGWRQGFDGVIYTIEFSSKSNYDFKNYWTPKAQDTTLVEAKVIQSFVDSMFHLSNSTIIWQTFQTTIPFECYTVGGTNICKVLTKKAKRRFAAERKNYRQHVH